MAGKFLRLPLYYLQTYVDNLSGSVECSGDNVILLLRCEVYKTYSVAGYTDREVSVFRVLRISLDLFEDLSAKYVYVEVVSALIEVTVYNSNEVVDSSGLLLPRASGFMD